MRAEYARLLALQAAITALGAAATYTAVGLQAAKSFTYGSMVAIISAIFLAWRYAQGGECQDAGVVLRQAYKTAIERFIWAIFLLSLGFKLLELAPMWLLAGFVVGQAAWLLAPIWMRLRTQNDK